MACATVLSCRNVLNRNGSGKELCQGIHPIQGGYLYYGEVCILVTDICHVHRCSIATEFLVPLYYTYINYYTYNAESLIGDFVNKKFDNLFLLTKTFKLLCGDVHSSRSAM